MRSVVLYVFSCFLALSINAQVVTIPDANFKAALLAHSPVIDLNSDGQIQVSEAVAFNGTMNVSSKSIANMTGVEEFINMKTLNCQSNQITILPTVGLSSLQNLWCTINKLTSLSVTNLLSLQTLYCGSNLLTSITLVNLPSLKELRCSDNKFTSLALNNLPALTIFDCYSNQLTSISLTNVNSLVSLSCSNNLLSTLPLTNVPQLKFLTCSFNQFTSLPLSNLNALTWLDCSNNQLSAINLPNPGILGDLRCSKNQLTTLPTGLNSLSFLDCSFNQISTLSLNTYSFLNYVNFESNLCASFSLSNKPQLTDIRCSNNLLSSFVVSNLPKLKYLRCDYNQLTTLSVTNFPLLYDLICSDNLLTALTVSNLPSLWELFCSNNKISSLTINNFSALERLACDNNQLTSLSISNSPAIQLLSCSSNLLTSLSLPNLPVLSDIYCPHNKLSALSLNNFPALRYLTCYDNLLTSLTLTNLPVLGNLQCQQNSFDSMSINNLPKLYAIWIGGKALSSLTLSNLPMLEFVNCDSTKLKALDLSQFPVRQLRCSGNDSLSYVNIKNGALSGGSYNVTLPSGLRYICVDDAEMTYINNQVNAQLPGRNVIVSSFCNYTPSGNYNIITGTLRFDKTANGCNNLDSTMSNIRVNITDGAQSGSSFTNAAGQYKFYVQSSPDTVTTALSNTIFTINPVSKILTFVGYGNTQIADFCVTANGVHPDVDISIICLVRPRPGFDTKYRIVYSNKGNQVQSGTFVMNFNTSKLSFVSASIPPASQAGNALNWNYAELHPYQTRLVDVTFHVALPPIANAGENIAFSGTINPVNGDETPADNHTRLVQTIVNSYDPNDKEVGEGSSIDIKQAGEYLHYTIHFQNTGNAEAIKIVIKDSLTNNLDWNSFAPITASHSFTANITKGNLVDFIFDNINLPPKILNEAASQGFVSFKIKPKSGITVGETINNQAKIYFDFNAPIITNTTSTTISTTKLGEDRVIVSVYPSPAKDHLSFEIRLGRQVSGFYLVNTLGVVVFESLQPGNNTVQQINTATLPSGVYYLVVNSIQWRSVRKIVILK